MYLSSRPTFPSGLYHSLIPLLVMPGAGKMKDCGSAENWNKCWRDSNGFRRGADKPTYVSRKKGGCLQISPERGPQSFPTRYSPLSPSCANIPRPKIWELRKDFRDAINAKTYDFLWNSSKFLHKAGANNPELSLTLARFMEPFWDGDARYHSIQQPGVLRRVPLHAYEKLEEMFCVVDYV